MTKKHDDTGIPQREIEALARCLLLEIQKFLKVRRDKRNLKIGKQNRLLKFGELD